MAAIPVATELAQKPRPRGAPNRLASIWWRAAAPGVLYRAFGEERRDPFFSSDGEYQLEALRCRSTAVARLASAADLPLRTFDFAAGALRITASASALSLEERRT